MRDAPPKAPPSALGTNFGSVVSESQMSFDYIEESADGLTRKAYGSSILIKKMQGNNIFERPANDFGVNMQNSFLLFLKT